MKDFCCTSRQRSARGLAVLCDSDISVLRKIECVGNAIAFNSHQLIKMTISSHHIISHWLQNHLWQNARLFILHSAFMNSWHQGHTQRTSGFILNTLKICNLHSTQYSTHGKYCTTAGVSATISRFKERI